VEIDPPARKILILDGVVQPVRYHFSERWARLLVC
jgi:hypothetical protein